MDKIFYLKTCNTCQKILKELEPLDSVVLREIKSEPINGTELKELYDLAGSYEALFSRRAVLYRQRNLKEKDLGEEDFKSLILEHYSFLKRPVMVIKDQIFIGNAKKQVESAKLALHG